MKNRFAAGLIDFITHAPTAVFAARQGAQLLATAGFKQLALTDFAQGQLRAGKYYYLQDGALIAWVQGETISKFTIVAAHSDSPSLKLKPLPQSDSPSGWKWLNVETYGGLLPATWFDRDLGLAGQVWTDRQETALVQTPAIMRIPSLAPHLERSLSKELHIDHQEHLHPIWTRQKQNILEYLRENTQSSTPLKGKITGWDLYAYDTQGPVAVGSSQEFLSSARQDNLLSCYSALQALINVVPQQLNDAVPMVVIYDHEEIGSDTITGAGGPILEKILHEILRYQLENWWQIIDESLCMSADVAHGVNPNYPGKHDPEARPQLGAGPVLKMNANQRYTTDGFGQALWERLCEQAQVHSQIFVSHNEVSCGTTIGPIAASRIGIKTFDVGAPILGMHSLREFSCFQDSEDMSKVMEKFLKIAL